jgi:hypothetical protein
MVVGRSLGAAWSCWGYVIAYASYCSYPGVQQGSATIVYVLSAQLRRHSCRMRMQVFVRQAEGGATAVVALVVTVLTPLRSSSANLAGCCVSRGVCGRVNFRD